MELRGDGRAPVVPIVVRSVSPEGVSVALRRDAAAPRQGQMVSVRFLVDRRDLVLPGRVVWVERYEHDCHVGVRLMLELAAASSRHTYAAWIVEQVTGQAAQAPVEAVEWTGPRTHVVAG